MLEILSRLSFRASINFWSTCWKLTQHKYHSLASDENIFLPLLAGKDLRQKKNLRAQYGLRVAKIDPIYQSDPHSTRHKQIWIWIKRIWIINGSTYLTCLIIESGSDFR